MVSMATRIGVLALQGAVSEHLYMVERSGAKGIQVKKTCDLDSIDALIIPGGESTAISRLIGEHGLATPLRAFAAHAPVLGTCAGLILCASEATGTGGALPSGNSDGATQSRVQPLGLVDMTVSRNGFGRQCDSFETHLAVKDIGDDIPAVFIRAPYIERVGTDVTVMATYEGKIVMARSGTVLVTSFHPELTDDDRVIRYFCAMIP